MSRARKLTRRGSLRLGAGALLAAGMSPLPVRALSGGALSASRTIVCIQLLGGADGLSLLPPLRDAGYRALRGVDAVTEAVPLTADVGLHPALRSLAPLYERGELMALTCVGSAGAGRTHLEAERAFADSLRSLSIAESCAADVCDAISASVGVLTVREPLALPLVRLGQAIASASAPPAVLVRIPGFDTHAAQRARLGALLAELDAGLSLFRAQLGAAFTNTVILITTERGRALRLNRMAGTEDGAGTAALIVGGSLAARTAPEPWPDLAELHARGERALPIATDLASVIALVREAADAHR